MLQNGARFSRTFSKAQPPAGRRGDRAALRCKATGRPSARLLAASLSRGPPGLRLAGRTREIGPRPKSAGKCRPKMWGRLEKLTLDVVDLGLTHGCYIRYKRAR